MAGRCGLALFRQLQSLSFSCSEEQNQTATKRKKLGAPQQALP